MATTPSKYLLRTAMAGTIGLLSLLFFPFGGFTEAAASPAGPVYGVYALAGLGTHGIGFDLFGYPGRVAVLQMAMLAGAVVLLYPISRCWRWHQAPGEATWAALRTASRVAIGVGAAAMLVVAVALRVVLPGAEGEMIWQTGAVVAWRPEYGAFVTAVSVGAMATALALRANRALDQEDDR
ncbi:MAG: hypothetical protein MUP76_11100 [Acidimicrobiia bacterium]|nr:hypothetical protein [Acidimicrobiia bacterium]